MYLAHLRSIVNHMRRWLMMMIQAGRRHADCPCGVKGIVYILHPKNLDGDHHALHITLT